VLHLLAGGVKAVAELTGRKGRMVRIAKHKSKPKSKPKSKSKSKLCKDDAGDDAQLKMFDVFSADGTASTTSSRTCSGTQLVYEKRNINGISMDKQNIHEKDLFMSGKKSIAIISEAASSGISLQADRRVKNQKRRVHITLELPWSAERAVQQLGRTHRSNQSSGPEYKLLISPCGGERRFAAAVAKRLESLGALTLGDRRASVGAKTLSMSTFNFDTKYGKQALDEIITWIANTLEVSVFRDIERTKDFSMELIQLIVDDVHLRTWLLKHIREDELARLLEMRPIPFALISRVWLYNIGIDVMDKTDVRRFLNRILGLEVEKQNLLFNLFLSRLDVITRAAKREGTYDTGVKELIGGRVYEENPPEVVYSAEVASGIGEMNTLLHTIDVDRGISWPEIELVYNTTEQQQQEKAKQAAGEGVKKPSKQGFQDRKAVKISKVKLAKAGFYLSKRGFQGMHFIIYAKEKDDVEEFQTSNIICYRPQTGKHELLRSSFHEKYSPLDFHKSGHVWTTEFELNTKRVVTWHMLSGAILPIWTAIAGSMRQTHGHVRIMRAVLEASRCDDTAAGGGRAGGGSSGSSSSAVVVVVLQ
jgi:hypothetical protein